MALLEGRILIEEYRLDEAISRLEGVLDDADFYEKKLILFYLGLAHHRRSNLQKCFENWDTLKKIENDRRKRSAIVGNIGIVYRSMGNLEEALRYLQEALQIDREIEYKEGEAIALGNIGIVYHSKGNPVEALKCYREALQIHREIGYRQGEANDLTNIGIVYQLKGNLDEALKYYQEALQIFKEIGYREGEAIDLGNIGIILKLLASKHILELCLRD